MRIAIGPAVLLLLLAGCGDKKSTAAVDELRSKTETLTKRIETLETNQLEAEKKLIQHQQALQTMHERVRSLEAQLDRARMGS